MHNVNLETELHVITPNEPGILGRVLGTLANAGVNLRALSVYSEPEAGHFRLLTSDNKKAETSLRALGYKVKTNKVITDRMVVNAAFLVDGKRQPQFDAAVTKLDEETGKRLTFKYVGPVPPYNFVNLVIKWDK